MTFHYVRFCLSEKFDVYNRFFLSLGVILYECLFGKAPYSSGTVEELVNKIKADRRIELPTSVSISDQCRDLLTKLLERDPEQRISFQQYFQHPFVDLEHAPGLDSLEKGEGRLA